MFKIELTDPQTIEKDVLFKIAKFILELSGHQLAEEPQRYEIGIKLENETVEARPEREVEPEILYGSPLGSTHNQPITITHVEGTTTEESQLDLERDASGDLWDKKIHSRTRSKDADGNWKLQRGIQKPVKTPVAPPPPPTAVPPPPPLASSDPVAPGRSFNNFVIIVTKAIGEGRLHTTKMIEIFNKYGVSDLPELPRVPGALEKVWDEIMEAIKP